MLAEIDGITSDTAKTPHERYLDVYQCIKKRDKELANAFDGPRRSTAIQQLITIQSLALLTPEEISGFSIETRSTLSFLLGEDEPET